MSVPNPQYFLDALFAELESRAGVLDHLFLDHLCYRVATVARYAELRDAWLGAGHALLTESHVNGRRISTFRLREPFRYGARSIPLIELPEPKEGSPYPEGYEHVEFVTDRPLSDFFGWLTEHLRLSPAAIDRSGEHKQHNGDLRVRLSGGRSVKFHTCSLEEVIASERDAEDKAS